MDGDAFLSFQDEPIREGHTLSFSFRAEAPNGLLALSRHRSVKDFLAIELVHGALFAQTELGSGVARVRLGHNLNNGYWHHVVLRQLVNGTDRALSLQLNSSSPFVAAIKPGSIHLDVNTGTFLGGFPEVDQGFREVIATEGLRGCLRSVLLDGAPLDSSNAVAGQDTLLAACSLLPAPQGEAITGCDVVGAAAPLCHCRSDLSGPLCNRGTPLCRALALGLHAGPLTFALPPCLVLSSCSGCGFFGQGPQARGDL
jgi:hypothetical protein